VGKEKQSIIIIGSGIAGLSTGCYAQMNGYASRIFEQHQLPGGLCTSWRRGDYTIDGCIHWLMGSAPGTFLHQIWNELGALRGRSFVYPDEYLRIVDKDGRVLVFYTDLDRLEQHLKELSPIDSASIGELVQGVRTLLRFDFPVAKAPELESLFDKIKNAISLLKILPTYRRWGRLSIAEVAERFEDPLLREGIRSVFMPEFPAMFMLVTLAWLHNKTSGYPVGGSLSFAKSIERRYLELGGQVQYRSTVATILVENDRAVGIRLEDGTEHRADYVVSAADLHSTVFAMLEERYVSADVRRYYDTYRPFPGLVLIGLGVARRFDNVVPSVSGMRLRLNEPLRVANEEHQWLNVNVRNLDPTLAPDGKTLLLVTIATDYAYWAKLKESATAYETEKKALATQVIRRLEQVFPGISGQVEMVDVATPVTFWRYTRNWRGSFEGWLATPTNWLEHVSKTLPGLSNFYMVGQWVEIGGGLPPAAFSGRHVVQLLCKRDGKRFLTDVPV
jgi:phytoene dehydrogenase-like protein